MPPQELETARLEPVVLQHERSEKEHCNSNVKGYKRLVELAVPRSNAPFIGAHCSCC